MNLSLNCGKHKAQHFHKTIDDQRRSHEHLLLHIYMLFFCNICSTFKTLYEQELIWRNKEDREGFPKGLI